MGTCTLWARCVVTAQSDVTCAWPSFAKLIAPGTKMCKLFKKMHNTLNRPSVCLARNAATRVAASATMVSVLAGMLCTMVALVCNGSFAVFAKLPRIAAIGMTPVTFMGFMAIGVVASCFGSVLLYPVLPLSPPHVVWTWYGVLAGALFVMSVTCSFLGIKYVGLAVAQGARPRGRGCAGTSVLPARAPLTLTCGWHTRGCHVCNFGAGTWGAAALIVSYVWGVAVFGNHVESVLGDAIAIVLLLVGGAGIAVCDDLGDYMQRWYTNRRGFGSARYAWCWRALARSAARTAN